MCKTASNLAFSLCTVFACFLPAYVFIFFCDTVQVMYCAFTVLFHGIGKNFIKMWTVYPFRRPGSTCWNVTSRICFTDFYKETWRSLADCNITERKAEPDWLKLRGLEWLAPKRQSKRPGHWRLCTTWIAEIRIKAKKMCWNLQFHLMLQFLRTTFRTVFM